MESHYFSSPNTKTKKHGRLYAVADAADRARAGQGAADQAAFIPWNSRELSPILTRETLRIWWWMVVVGGHVRATSVMGVDWVSVLVIVLPLRNTQGALRGGLGEPTSLRCEK
jgi:hypothetical protein